MAVEPGPTNPVTVAQAQGFGEATVGQQVAVASGLPQTEIPDYQSRVLAEMRVQLGQHRTLFNLFDLESSAIKIPEENMHYSLSDLSLGPLGEEFGNGGAATRTRLVSELGFGSTWNERWFKRTREEFVAATNNIEKLVAFLKAVQRALETLEEEYRQAVEADESLTKQRTEAGQPLNREEREQVRTRTENQGYILEDLNKFRDPKVVRGLENLTMIVAQAKKYVAEQGDVKWPPVNSPPEQVAE